ncbi:MAG: hypothetical protein PHO31_03240, partial [Candidatus Pacebacteria bacterium]|nr:hypothetical protein [Candidatus Paceibacterota bacterium]
KKANLSRADEIMISFEGDESIINLLRENEDEMKKQLRIKKVFWNKPEKFAFQEKLVLDGKEINISFEKIRDRIF